METPQSFSHKRIHIICTLVHRLGPSDLFYHTCVINALFLYSIHIKWSVCVCVLVVSGAFVQLSITPALAAHLNNTLSLSSNQYDRRTLAARYHSLRKWKSQSERDGSACARDLSLSQGERETDEYLCPETCGSTSPEHTDPDETQGETETGEGFWFCIRHKIRLD